MVFWPNFGVMLKILSSEVSEDSDINYMPAVKFFTCLELEPKSSFLDGLYLKLPFSGLFMKTKIMGR